MNFMKNPLLIKKITYGARITLLLFLPISFFLIFTTCSSPTKPSFQSKKFTITKEEKIWLREFFQALLFEDPGVYVLYGTKPMSWAILSKSYTQEEKAQMMAWYESLSAEEKAKYIVRADRPDFHENFQKWQEIKHRFPITQYLFGTFPSRYPHVVEDSLFFVNIEQMVRTLLKNYSDFRRVLGYDFDPLKVVFEIEDRDSKFWKEVIHNHALLGILLGFGRDNAWFFEWDRKYENEQSKINEFLRSLSYNFYEKNDPPYQVSSQNFLLPIYGSYGLYPNDKELFDQYKKEQKQIKALYRGRDEVDVALEWLTR